MGSTEQVTSNEAPAAPPPFPVEWDSPEEAQAMWLFDVIHCPAPLSPLDFDLRMSPLCTGANRVYQAFGVPVQSQPKLIHGFVFQRLVFPNLQPDAVSTLLQEADSVVRRTYRELGGLWEGTWLPEIQGHLSHWAAFDPGRADFSDLVARLVDFKGRAERLWELHNLILYPVLVALSDFEEMHRDLFPDAKPLDVYELLAGIPNKTTESNTRLWELGRTAARTPQLHAQLSAGASRATKDILSETPEGQALWAQIQDYLGSYGERNDDLYINHPTWTDDPMPVLQGLCKAVSEPDRDLAQELRRQAERREARLAEVRAFLASHPRAVQEEFEALLSAAQVATVLTEDHHFWIDTKVTYHARRLSLEVGRRLAARGILANPDDVFQLTLTQIIGLGEDAAEAGRLRAGIEDRKAEAARFAGVTPPPFLGVPSPMLNIDCAIVRASAKFNGNLYAPPGPGSDLTGMAGSRGKVTGPARVVHSVDEAARLKAGEILVASHTLPSWTPFFASAAAVVTNVGGILCHAAVVAREYGIPAVVGTGRATVAIRDGQIIEVDGDAGIVRLPTS